MYNFEFRLFLNILGPGDNKTKIYNCYNFFRLPYIPNLSGILKIDDLVTFYNHQIRYDLSNNKHVIFDHKGFGRYHDFDTGYKEVLDYVKQMKKFGWKCKKII